MKAHPMRMLLGVTLWICAALSVVPAVGGPSPEEIEKAVAAIRSYDHGHSESALRAVERLIHQTHGSPDLRAAIEKELVKVLESDVTLACKQWVCRKLAIIGTDASIPALAKMLASAEDPAVQIACYSLLQIKSPAVERVLRDAMRQAKGKARVAIVTLLGDRRDDQSVTSLAALAESGDAMASEAALGALGKIAGKQAAAVLARFRKSENPRLRAAAEQASLQCAQEFAARGDPGGAQAIYAELAASGVPFHIRRGALLGRIRLGGPEAASLILSTLKDKDSGLKAAAIASIPTVRDPEAAGRFAERLAELPAAEQVLMIDALARLGHPAARSAITRAAAHADAAVRLAAIQALGTIGDASSVAVLVSAFASGPRVEAEVAAASLRALNADGADAEIVKSMRRAQGRLRAELIRVLGDRRTAAAVPALMAEAAGKDLAICQAAFRALGAVAGAADLPAMVKLLAELKADGARADAEQAVAAVARRVPGRSSTAETLLASLRAAKDTPTRCSLLRVLGTIAEDRACSALVEAAKDQNAEIKDMAVRVLADWPDARAIEPLRGILASGPNRTHRTLALRGYVRLLAASQDAPAVLAERFAEAMSYAQGTDDQKLVLSGLANVPHRDALRLAAECLKHAGVRTEAALAAIAIARKLPDSDAAAIHAAMKAVLEAVGDAAVQEQAKALLRQPPPPKK